MEQAVLEPVDVDDAGHSRDTTAYNMAILEIRPANLHLRARLRQARPVRKVVTTVIAGAVQEPPR